MSFVVVNKKQWKKLCFEQSWNDSSKVTLLENFLESKGLMEEFVEYVEEVAIEENSESW